MEIFSNKIKKIECDGENFIMNGKKNRYHLFLEDYFIQMLAVATLQVVQSEGPILNHSFEYYNRNLSNDASNVCFQGLQRGWLIRVDFKLHVTPKVIIQGCDITHGKNKYWEIYLTVLDFWTGQIFPKILYTFYEGA